MYSLHAYTYHIHCMYSYNAYDTYLHVYMCTYALLYQIYNPRSREYIGSADVTRQVGLPPDQLKDYWALTGDAVVGAATVVLNFL